MPTDSSNQIQEVADPEVDKRPDSATTKESSVTPNISTMDGNVESAYQGLLRIIENLKSRENVNENLLNRALDLKAHYEKTKNFSPEQYSWIDSFLNPPSSPLPEFEPKPTSEPIIDPEGDAKRLKELQAKRRQEIESRASQVPSIKPGGTPEPVIVEETLSEEEIEDVMEDVIEPDSSPTGEEQTDERTV